MMRAPARPAASIAGSISSARYSNTAQPYQPERVNGEREAIVRLHGSFLVIEIGRRKRAGEEASGGLAVRQFAVMRDSRQRTPR